MAYSKLPQIIALSFHVLIKKKKKYLILTQIILNNKRRQYNFRNLSKCNIQAHV